MSIELKVGSIFETETKQLRQITKIATDEKGRVRISYNSKSAKIPNRDFEKGHTQENPPLDSTFKDESGKQLNKEEINEYIRSNILRNDEVF